MPNRPQSGPAFTRAGEPSLSLRVLVDRSIVEAYAQGGRASAISRKRPDPRCRPWAASSKVSCGGVAGRCLPERGVGGRSAAVGSAGECHQCECEADG